MSWRGKGALLNMDNSLRLDQLKTHLTFDDVLLLPNYSEVAPERVHLETRLATNLNLEIPILSAPMDTVTESDLLIALGKLGGLGVLHRNLSIDMQVLHLKKALDANVKAAVAVGFGSDFEQRVYSLAKLNPSAICIDSAHGHTKNILDLTRFVSQNFPGIPLISGNVATYEGARALFEAGASIVKVGMGPGSICTTRIITGVGAPQLSAIVECARAAREFKGTIIADGGIRNSGDIVKALAAGASSVMLGSLLAGTNESAGELFMHEERQYKSYRGMGSIASMIKGSAERYGQHFDPNQQNKLIPEGIEGLVPARGPLEEWLHQLLGGIRSACGYLGASSIADLAQKARFIRVTPASLQESHPHSILHNKR